MAARDEAAAAATDPVIGGLGPAGVEAPSVVEEGGPSRALPQGSGEPAAAAAAAANDDDDSAAGAADAVSALYSLLNTDVAAAGGPRLGHEESSAEEDAGNAPVAAAAAAADPDNSRSDGVDDAAPVYVPPTDAEVDEALGDLLYVGAPGQSRTAQVAAAASEGPESLARAVAGLIAADERARTIYGDAFVGEALGEGGTTDGPAAVEDAEESRRAVAGVLAAEERARTAYGDSFVAEALGEGGTTDEPAAMAAPAAAPPIRTPPRPPRAGAEYQQPHRQYEVARASQSWVGFNDNSPCNKQHLPYGKGLHKVMMQVHPDMFISMRGATAVHDLMTYSLRRVCHTLRHMPTSRLAPQLLRPSPDGGATAGTFDPVAFRRGAAGASEDPADQPAPSVVAVRCHTARLPGGAAHSGSGTGSGAGAGAGAGGSSVYGRPGQAEKEYLLTCGPAACSWETASDLAAVGLSALVTAFEAQSRGGRDAEYTRWLSNSRALSGDPHYQPGAWDELDVCAVLQRELPGELAKHAISEVRKILRYFDAGVVERNTTSAEPLDADVSTLQQSCRVVCSIAETGHLASAATGRNIGLRAAIGLTAYVEYMSAEVLELAGNAAKDLRRRRIAPRMVMLAVEGDHELSRFYTGIWDAEHKGGRRWGQFVGAGVIPCYKFLACTATSVAPDPMAVNAVEVASSEDAASTLLVTGRTVKGRVAKEYFWCHDEPRPADYEPVDNWTEEERAALLLAPQTTDESKAADQAPDAAARPPEEVTKRAANEALRAQLASLAASLPEGPARDSIHELLTKLGVAEDTDAGDSPGTAGGAAAKDKEADSDDETADCPPEFLCPILQDVMTDPVMTCDGHTYERAAIERWLASHGRSPVTNASLDHTRVRPNLALKLRIQRWRARRAAGKRNLQLADTAAPKSAAAVASEADDSGATPEEAKDGTAAPEEAEDGTAAPEEAKAGIAAPEEAEDGTAAPEEAEDGTAAPEEAKDGTAAPEEAGPGGAQTLDAEVAVSTTEGAATTAGTPADDSEGSSPAEAASATIDATVAAPEEGGGVGEGSGAGTGHEPTPADGAEAAADPAASAHPTSATVAGPPPVSLAAVLGLGVGVGAGVGAGVGSGAGAGAGTDSGSAAPGAEGHAQAAPEPPVAQRARDATSVTLSNGFLVRMLARSSIARFSDSCLGHLRHRCALRLAAAVADACHRAMVSRRAYITPADAVQAVRAAMRLHLFGTGFDWALCASTAGGADHGRDWGAMAQQSRALLTASRFSLPYGSPEMVDDYHEALQEDVASGMEGFDGFYGGTYATDSDGEEDPVAAYAEAIKLVRDEARSANNEQARIAGATPPAVLCRPFTGLLVELTRKWWAESGRWSVPGLTEFSPKWDPAAVTILAQGVEAWLQMMLEHAPRVCAVTGRKHVFEMADCDLLLRFMSSAYSEAAPFS